MKSPFHCPFLPLAFLVWSSADAHAAEHEPYRVDAVPAEAYDRAVALTTVAVQGTVKNPSVTPHWLPGGEAFWYRRDAGDGTEYVLVDADTGSRRPAFDHEALAKALSTLDGQARAANALAIDAMHFDEALSSVDLKAGELAARCDLRAATCETLPAWLSRRHGGRGRTAATHARSLAGTRPALCGRGGRAGSTTPPVAGKRAAIPTSPTSTAPRCRANGRNCSLLKTRTTA